MDDIGVGSNHYHEHVIIVLCHLGYLIYKKNKLIFIKNEWDNMNMVFTIADGLCVT